MAEVLTVDIDPSAGESCWNRERIEALAGALNSSTAEIPPEEVQKPGCIGCRGCVVVDGTSSSGGGNPLVECTATITMPAVDVDGENASHVAPLVVPDEHKGILFLRDAVEYTTGPASLNAVPQPLGEVIYFPTIKPGSGSLGD